MQKTLKALEPQLAIAAKKVAETVRIVEAEKKEAEIVAKVVSAEEKITGEQASAAEAIADDCNARLEQALPILNSAMAALNTLTPQDITIVKTMKSPPAGIKLVMEAVLILKDVKPDRIPNPGGVGMVEDYWGPSKRVLGDLKFLESLINFDKDNINPKIIHKLQTSILNNENFDPDKVKTASTAAEGKFLTPNRPSISIVTYESDQHWSYFASTLSFPGFPYPQSFPSTCSVSKA